MIRIWREKTGIWIKEGYGQTETTLVAATFKGKTKHDDTVLGGINHFIVITLHQKQHKTKRTPKGRKENYRSEYTQL